MVQMTREVPEYPNGPVTADIPESDVELLKARGWLVSEVSEKTALVKEALDLGVLGPDGKAAAESVLERWALKRLREAVAGAKADARTANEKKALTLKVGTAEEIASLSDEELVAAIEKASA